MVELRINGETPDKIVDKKCEFDVWNDIITIDAEEIYVTPSPGAEYWGEDEFGDGLYKEVRIDDDGNEYHIVFKMWDDAGDEDGEHPEPEDCCDWENPVRIILYMAEEAL